MRKTTSQCEKRWAAAFAGVVSVLCGWAAVAAARHGTEPRATYDDVADIDAEAEALRDSGVGRSFSRGWFSWDRFLCRYQDAGRRSKNDVKILRAVFLGGILDRYRALAKKGEGDRFHIFYGPSKRGNKYYVRDVHGGGGHGGWGGAARMRIYEELVRQNMLTGEERALFKKIVIQSLSERFVDYNRLERGANNRPFANNGGVAIALRLFPDMPRAKEIRAWLHRLWREWAEYGDTTEINYYPYGPLFLHGMLDIAENLGKLKTEREFIYAVAKRYRDQWHGSGVRGCPNAGARANRDLSAISENPWHVAAFSPREVHFWYRMAKEFRDPTFLWAAEQSLLGGKGPGGRAPPEYWKAYNERFRIFNQMGLRPKMPESRSTIAHLSPLKHQVPERLYLDPGREAGKAFVSYYIYDRNNEYMHCFNDAAGRLYEYVVDGTKLLHSSGKYNGIFWGQWFYDMLLVLHPHEAFPFNPPDPNVRWQRSGFHGVRAGVWHRASGTLHMMPACRTGPDSKTWVYDEAIGLFRRPDDPVGFSHGNMDGLWKLNDDYHLKSVSIVLHGAPLHDRDKKAAPQEAETVLLQDLRLAGPKGDIMLARFDELPEGLKVTRWRRATGDRRPTKADETRLRGKALEACVRITREGRSARKALRLRAEPGFSYAVAVTGLDLRFNVDRDYTRITFNYKAVSKAPFLRRQGWRYGAAGYPMLLADVVLNSRSVIPVHQIRGGILVEDSLRAENEGNDSFGRFTHRNYFAAHSRWTRQTVLTEEGYLIVRDEYLAGNDAHGYHAGPIWCLRADGKWIEGKHRNGRPWRKFENAPVAHDGKRNWFDAPPYDHAWWQNNPKRLLVYIHPDKGHTYGQIQQGSSPDFSREIRRNCSFVKARVQAGRPKVFLSVLVPHEAEEEPKDVVKRIRTRVSKDGEAAATIGNVQVTIGADGEWHVTR